MNRDDTEMRVNTKRDFMVNAEGDKDYVKRGMMIVSIENDDLCIEDGDCGDEETITVFQWNDLGN